MKMPCRSTITVDAPVREALSPKRPLGYTSVVSVVVKAASRICQARAGPRAERSGEESRDKRLKCRILSRSSDPVCVLANHMGCHPRQWNGDENLHLPRRPMPQPQGPRSRQFHSPNAYGPYSTSSPLHLGCGMFARKIAGERVGD